MLKTRFLFFIPQVLPENRRACLHTTGGYCLYTNLTFSYIFDYHEEDIHFCTADIGWVTGHSYIVYGPLSNGATSLMFEGVPTYPNPGRFWSICREAQGKYLLYSTDCYQGADERG